MPGFVKWNWPLIRKVSFFMFFAAIIAMCSVVFALIYTLPKACHPEMQWYRGGVFYEIFPASFEDSDG
jgi:hypothetical protein